MHVKIPNEDESPNIQQRDKSCTSSIYISQPSISVLSNDQVHELRKSAKQSPSVDGCSVEQKPVLTIHVNQNNPPMNQSASNLVNIVSCFRAYPTINHSGIENVVHSNNAPFSVSVNRNNCSAETNKSDESVNNENNQNIVNIEASSKSYAHNNVNAHFKPAIAREDLNEIRVDQILISDTGATSPNSSSNVDYQNMTLDSVANRDQVELIGAETERIVIATASGTGVNADFSPNPQQSSESVINQITITGGVKRMDNCASNDNCAKTESQTFRDQRRRERRERRQARQRAQHGHHHITATAHQRPSGIRTGNGVELSRTNYEILPDIINNHFPPPYTTLPIQMPALPIHSPITISPVPVVVDDCRFSFPIPIIRR